MKRALMRRRPAATTTAAVAGLGVALLAGIGVAAAATTGVLTAHSTPVSAAHAHAAERPAGTHPAAAQAKAAQAKAAAGPGAKVAKVGWAAAQEVPGTATLNVGGDAAVNSVSCTAVGDCTAGGYYASTVVTKGNQTLQAFVADETNGTWGTAQEVPGTAALNVSSQAEVTSVSCVSPGSCSAGGFYGSGIAASAQLELEAFVVTETNGTWGNAQEVPGSDALNAGQSARIVSMSCTSAGNCSAGGFYSPSVNNSLGVYSKQAFVVTESNGTWGSAQAVPGIATLNAGVSATVSSISCTSPGNCSAGGQYASAVNDGIPTEQAFVATQTGGTWGNAVELPGTAALNAGVGAYAGVNSLSCASAGNCSAGGLYINGSNVTEPFVDTEVSGTWGSAQEVPGITALNTNGLAQVDSVSCTSAGNCDAGGYYQDANFINQAFVVTEVSDTWGSAQEVPGSATLNKGNGGAADVTISCVPNGTCGAGGHYQGSGNVFHAFLEIKSGGTWASATAVSGAPTSSAGAQTESVSCLTGYCGAGGYFSLTARHTEAFVANATLGS